MTDTASDQPVPPVRGRKTGPRHTQLPWRQDVVILARLLEVERRHLAGQPNTLIAAALGVDEGVIRGDLKRLRTLWLERIGAAQEDLRAQKLAELLDIKQRALTAAEFDLQAESDVLYNDSLAPDHEGGPSRRVVRDERGRAEFRGQKAQALNVARQAVMDAAKLLGLVLDKAEIAGPGGGPVAIREVTVHLAKRDALDDPGQ